MKLAQEKKIAVNNEYLVYNTFSWGGICVPRWSEIFEMKVLRSDDYLRDLCPLPLDNMRIVLL